jgi:TetR/AcrR family transcriptional regulator, transcriptional repressor for nem operon
VRVAEAKQRGQVDTAARVLDVAERLVQIRGFNGFSYADVATELHLTKASLHYHYAGKAELGEALISRYAERFSDSLAEIDTLPFDAPTKLEAYATLYANVLRAKRMCLCGMLAAEYRTLPKPMQDAVIRFFDDNEGWLAKVLVQGRDEGSLRFTGSPNEAARMIVSVLEGAMLVSRPYGDIDRFEAAAGGVLASLAAPVTRRPRSRQA